MTREEAAKKFEPYIDNECYTDSFQEACRMAIEAIKNERPKGHWVEVYDLDYLSYLYSCDQCGEPAPTKRETMFDQILTGYCPNCGADMRGEEE